MPIDKSRITRELLEKAAQCKTAEELIALAKAEGYDITKEQAEAYLAELANYELDEKALDKVAGGVCWSYCPNESSCSHHVCGAVGW